MLSTDVVFELLFPQLLTALLAFVKTLRAVLEMDLHVSLLYNFATLKRAFHFELVY